MPVVLSYGITAEDIGGVFRSLYLETLIARLREQGRPATVPRLALMAGLTRGEVESILSRRDERRRLRSRNTRKLDEAARVLAAWHDDSRFSTPYGAPLDLSLQPERGFKTFADLIEAAGAGSDPSLVLDDLLAAGCVEVHAEKFVRCVSRVFIPTGIDISRIARIGRLVGALNSTLAHNLLRKPDEPSYYERGLGTSGLLRQEFRDVALRYLHANVQPFLEQLDRWFESQEEEFGSSQGSRFGVCTFFFEEPQVVDEPMEIKQTANAN
jgi:Family of unknown function (DUF6502)